MDKSSTDFLTHDLMTYLWVVVLSLWAGMVSYFDKARKFSWVRLLTHLSSSAFAGTMMYLICQAAGITGPGVGAISGIAAHLGTPALIRLLMRSKFLKQYIEDEKKGD